jgi:hypothetical protein
MTRIPALTLALFMTAWPASAQTDDGPGIFQRGFDMIFRNLTQDAGPQLRDLSGALDQMAPVLRDLAVLVDDLENYHPPQRLPNGDVIIRRRENAPPPPPIGDSLRGLTQDPPADLIDPDAPQTEL